MDDAKTESIHFIKTDLIPEMVHNRCFCQPGSREFVECESVSVTAVTPRANGDSQLYKAKVIIRFSGEAQSFHTIVKLLPMDCQDQDHDYSCFLNEEMFYNKMTAKYKLDVYPKCYAADMGRYGRPIVVLEDLEAVGYHRTDSLDGDHLKLVLEAIAKFHARGIELKHQDFSIFREFYAKLMETGPTSNEHSKKIERALERLRTSESEFSERVSPHHGAGDVKYDPKEGPFFTICHGNLDLDHLLFLYEGKTPIDIKILGWNKMAYTWPTLDLELIFRQTKLETKCCTQIHENFQHYFNTLHRESTTIADELLHKFLSAFFIFSTCSTTESPERERKLINFLSSL